MKIFFEEISGEIDHSWSIFRGFRPISEGSFFMRLTFDVDARTASALLKYAARWDMTPGEIVDSLMRFYKREMHRLYNKRGRK